MATIKYKNGNTWTQIVAQDVDALSTTTTDEQSVQGYVRFNNSKYPYTSIADLTKDWAGSDISKNSVGVSVADKDAHNVAEFWGGTNGSAEMCAGITARGWIAGEAVSNSLSVALEHTTGTCRYHITDPWRFREALLFGHSTYLSNTSSTAVTWTSTTNATTIASVTPNHTGLWLIIGHVSFGSQVSNAGWVSISVNHQASVCSNQYMGTVNYYFASGIRPVLTTVSTMYITESDLNNGKTAYLNQQNNVGLTSTQYYTLEAHMLG